MINLAAGERNEIGGQAESEDLGTEIVIINNYVSTILKHHKDL